MHRQDILGDKELFVHPLSKFHFLIDKASRYPQGGLFVVSLYGLRCGCNLYGIASATVLKEDSWISLLYSESIEMKQVVEWGEGGGAIVINVADADLCCTSGKCSHFRKSPQIHCKSPPALKIR